MIIIIISPPGKVFDYYTLFFIIVFFESFSQCPSERKITSALRHTPQIFLLTSVVPCFGWSHSFLGFLYYYFTPWESFTRVRVTRSFHKLPGLFSVFWPISIMQYCTNSLVTVPRAPITIRITITFMFHCFFNSLARSMYLSFFWLSFNSILWSTGTAESTILQILFFLKPRLGDYYYHYY